MFRDLRAGTFAFKSLFDLSERRWKEFNLLRTLVRRSLEARYKGSALGNLWSILNPLAQLLIYTYVFSVVLKVKLDLRDVAVNEDLTFGLWLFAGLVPWLAFSGGVVQSSTAVIAQPNLVKKVVFPLTLLPLVPVLAAFVESAAAIAILIIMVAFTTGNLQKTLLFFPLVWLIQILLTAGLGYWFAGLTVFLRDIPQALMVGMNIWMYGTPIIYPASAIPEAWRQWIFWLNPMTPVVESYRDIVLVGHMRHWSELTVAGLIAIAVFFTGFFCYRRMRPAFADVL